MTVIFDRMVQRNKKTGWEKRIRCVLADASLDPDECKNIDYRQLLLFLSLSRENKSRKWASDIGLCENWGHDKFSRRHFSLFALE